MIIKRVVRRNAPKKKELMKVMVFESGDKALSHVKGEMNASEKLILLVGVENGWAVVSRIRNKFPAFGGGGYLSDFTA